MQVKTQKVLINTYFFSLHIVGIYCALFDIIKQHPNLLTVYMFTGLPVFFALYLYQLSVFSNKLITQRKDLYDENVYINPLAPNRRWNVNPFSLFNSSSYSSLKGELASRKILVKTSLIYSLISFIMVVIVGVLAF